MKVEPANNPDAVLTGPFEQVVSLCESFSTNWQPESQASIDTYLRLVSEDARSTLLRNLLAIEIDLRRAAGERPAVEEYLGRFPQHSALVRDAFLHVSSVSSVGPEDTAKPKAAGDRRAGSARRLPEPANGCT